MVIVKIQGGLGNQLFQYSTGRALSIHLNTELKLDLEFFDTDEKKKVMRLNAFACKYTVASPNDYESLKTKEKPDILTKVANRLGIRYTRLNKTSHIVEEDVLKLLSQSEKNKNYYVEGWLGSEQYFKNIREILLKELDADTRLDQENTELLSRLESLNSVSIHIRRGDYLTNDYFKTLTIDYYLTAIEDIKRKIENPSFFFFSDDIDWVKSNFSYISNVYFVEKNSIKDTKWSTTGDVEDLMLMRSAKHQIIANSTYSWWAAWLNENPNKLVYYPETWYENKEAQKKFETGNFIPSDWKKIKF